MRLIFFVILLCAATNLSMCLPVSAAPSGHAALRAHSLYTGGERGEKGERRVELYLLDGNFFVLRQSFSARGKAAVARDMTGTWRQAEGGSILRLSNRHGLSLRLNIGGRDLYGDFFPASNGLPQCLVLKETLFSKPSFNVMGRLERAKDQVTLTDSATGRICTHVKDDALAALPGTDPLFVDAMVLPSKNTCTIERIRSFSTRFPSQAETELTNEDFRAAVEGVVWLLPSLPGLPTSSCTFSGKGKGQGSLEVTGQGLRLEAKYALNGQSLNFIVRKEDAKMLHACGAEALPRILTSVRSWSLETGALVLTASDGQSFLLEKAAPHGRMISRKR